MSEKKLAEYLSEVFKEELIKELKKEIDIKEYLSQESFDSCGSRSRALLDKAFNRVENILTMAIINHRESEHEEEFKEEKEITTMQLKEEDITTARGTWWRSS